jgi:hypothetical protein
VCGQGAQVFSFIVLYNAVGKGNGYCAVGFFIVGFISSTAVVTGATDTEVIVSGNGGDTAFAYFVNHFVGPNVVSNQVAQAIDCIGLLAVEVFKKGLECGKVGMYIGEQCYGHNFC